MSLTNILFFDVETVPVEPDFASLSPHGADTFTKRFRSVYDKMLWEDPVSISNPANQADYQLEVWQQVYEQNVSLLAEYAKVACISVGFVDKTNAWHSKSFCGPDERKVLTDFCDAVSHKDVFRLCAHNGKTFDLPFLVRRLLIHGMKVPEKLQIMGLKPWDLKWIIDTQELWSLGDLRYFPSLDRICYAFSIQSPKSEMDGSQVASVFYSDAPDRFEKIARYCECDIVALVLVLACLYQLPKPSNL